MKHIGIFSNSGDVRTAIYAGTLEHPYVAMVSGALVYDSIDVLHGAWVEDSAGNIYSGGIAGPDNYHFDFYKPTGATWTMYYEGQVVTAATYYMEKIYICDGAPDIAEVVREYGYPVEDINTGTGGDAWADSAVNITIDWDMDTMGVNVSTKGENCNDFNPCREYEEGTQEKCSCEGHYWYNDTCNDEPAPEPSCEDQGLCDDGEGNCVECEPDPEEEGEPEEE